jgi:hypothetical protein
MIASLHTFIYGTASSHFLNASLNVHSTAYDSWIFEGFALFSIVY